MIFSDEWTIASGFAIWFVALAAILLVQRGRALVSVGLVLAYLLGLGVIHVPGAMLYLDEGYRFYDPELVRLGFQQTAFFVLGFGCGAVITIWLWRNLRASDDSEMLSPVNSFLPDPRVYWTCVAIGLINYFFLAPILGRIPTLSAVSSVLNQLLLLGICLGMWHGWHTRKWSMLLVWGLFLGLLPVMTMLEQGFIGFGVYASLTGLAFAFSFMRPRWLLFVIGAGMLFFGLSAFVTYARDRGEIRQVVWGGESYEERIGQLVETFSEFEWYDSKNSRQLNSIDQRLNQNHLVGAAVQNVESGKVYLRNGDTIVQALLAWIPRIIWADKPAQAGSGDMVTSMTGIKFAEGTSVGVGQVLEFYMNFGAVGTIVGGMIWGVVLALLDLIAARALQFGNIARFMLYYLVGLSFLQPGGSLVEVVATAAAAVVVAFFLNNVALPFLFNASDRQNRAGAKAIVSSPK